MVQGDALRIALQLLHAPAHSRLLRSEPLPAGVLQLLRIVAGEREAMREAVVASGRNETTVVQSAEFFVEQVLWYPDADCYRVLGLASDASAPDLRRHMSLMMLWLRSDVGRSSERSVFVRRVTSAWNELKTPERRARYDVQLKAASSNAKRSTPAGGRQLNGERRATAASGGPRPFLHRLLAYLLPRPPHN